MRWHRVGPAAGPAYGWPVSRDARADFLLTFARTPMPERKSAILSEKPLPPQRSASAPLGLGAVQRSSPGRGGSLRHRPRHQPRAGHARAGRAGCPASGDRGRSRGRTPSSSGARSAFSAETRSARSWPGCRSTIPEAMAYLRSANGVRSLYQLVPGRTMRAVTTDEGALVSLRYLNGDGTELVVRREGERVHRQRSGGADRKRAGDGLGRDRDFALRSDRPGRTQRLGGGTAGRDLLQRGRFPPRSAPRRSLLGGLRGPVQRWRVHPHRPHRGCRVQQRRPCPSRRVLPGSTGPQRLLHARRQELRKAFLRSPLEFSRISSGFTTSRFHPVLRTLACAQGRGLRRTGRHARQGHRRRRRGVRRAARGLRQSRDPAASQRPLDAVRAPVRLREGHARRSPRRSGRGDRLRRA